MAEEHRDHSDREESPKTVTRLSGNMDPSKQDHGIKREHNQAAHKSFLLGNDGENEVVVSHGAGQVTQSILGPLPPTLASQTTRTDRNQRLLHVVGFLLLKREAALAPRGGVTP